MTKRSSSLSLEAAKKLLTKAGYKVLPPLEVKFGCHVDLAEGDEPDGCVLDIGDVDGCVFASQVKCKEACKYWRQITRTSVAEAIKEDWAQ